VRRLERLPSLAEDDLKLPELIMLLATDLAALDHHEGAVTLIANAVNWDNSPERVDAAYDDAVARLDRMTEELRAPAPSTVAVYRPAQPNFVRRRSLAEHCAAVVAAKEEILAGEAFQVVVSQRFETEISVDSLEVYRVLRRRRTRARTCTCCGSRTPRGSGSTSSGPARRHWSPSRTGRPPRTRSRAPGGAGPPRRRPAAGEGTCARTRKSAPST